ncbi:MAG TPA: c-type cytochrome [Flavilitoribacter sp.]|nr:c-type cytochrome [Flavilitoribacter sp.]HMQ89278.1 c-type cytochrome [Flavilitoribacter sp.]
MKRGILILVITAILASCGGNGPSVNDTNAGSSSTTAAKSDDGLGIGEIKHVEMNAPLDQTMVSRGKAIYDMKCSACHKLTGQRVVGPGWAGVTTRRKPEWIMNMATNVDVMLEQDPTARELLKECLVKMPNQNLSVGDARDVLEFMLNNDAGQTGQ